MQTTVQDTAVPIALVDEDQQEFSELMVERLYQEERIRIQLMTLEEMNHVVQTGEVEAGFVLEKGFTESVHNGQINDSIRWIRSERSTFDPFAKELIGAELMRIVLSSKAANVVSGEGVATWEEAYRYAESFWQPTPLFEMEFEQRNQNNPSSSSPVIQISEQIIFALFLLYAWGLGLVLFPSIIREKNSGIVQRIKLMQHHLFYYYAGKWLSILIAVIVTYILSSFGMLLVIPTSLWLPWVIWGVCVLAVTVTICYGLFVLCRHSKNVLVVIGLYSLGSFIMYMMVLSSIDLGGMEVASFFPHVWFGNNPLTYLGGIE